LIALATVITGGIIYLLSSLPAASKLTTDLQSHVSELSSILTGYAFTVAGFLATIATFLFTLGDKPYFQFYKRRGSFGDLMFLHALSLAVLAGVFVFAIVILANSDLLRLTLVLTILSLIQLFMLTMVSYNLSKRSND
jgi:hypothetical protein